MKTDICNEVFSVTLRTRTLILGLNEDPKQMTDSEKYIPLFV